MLLGKILDDVQAKTGVTKFMQIIIVGLLFANVLQAANTLFEDRSVRTQLVPPEIRNGFWVDGKHLDKAYLEEMGEFIALKYASVTPSSVDASNDTILRYVDPSIHGELAVRFRVAADKLKHDGVSRLFFPREVRVLEAQQAVAFIGLMETWIGDKKVPAPEAKAFLVAFRYAGGRVTLKELRETSPQDPFAPPAKRTAEQ